MICSNCGQSAYRIRIINSESRCNLCGGFSEAGGFRSDGVLSRQRVRDQGIKYEGDTLNPWKYNKDEKAFVPNNEFIKRHAHNAHNFYTPQDVEKTHPKLAKMIGEGFKEEVTVSHQGSEKEAFKEVIKA